MRSRLVHSLRVVELELVRPDQLHRPLGRRNLHRVPFDFRFRCADYSVATVFTQPRDKHEQSILFKPWKTLRPRRRCGELSGKLGQRRGDFRERQADDIGVGAANLADHVRGMALDTVGSGLVEWLAGGKVGFDLGIG